MPIIASSFTFTPPDSVEPLVINFTVLNENSQPIPEVPYTVTPIFNTMFFNDGSSTPKTGETGTDGDAGKGSVELFADMPDGAFNVLQIVSSGQTTNVPVGLYNKNSPSTAVISGAVNINGVTTIQQSDLIENGLSIRVTLPQIVNSGDTAFICIGSFYEFMFPIAGTTYTTFHIPAGFGGQHALNSGTHQLFYGLFQPSGNCVVPDVTNINIVGTEPTEPLLPVSMNNRGGEYINATDNRFGFNITIPGDQAGVSNGDTYTIVYSLTDPANGNVSTTVLASNTIANAAQPTVAVIPPYSFPQLNETVGWFWYTISSPDKLTRTSLIVRRIIDTI